jgi:hypothetical protein
VIPHDQTFVGNGDAGAVPGNCMQACMASVLDLPLDLVPHFALFGDKWGEAIVLWVQSRGKSLRVYNDWNEHKEWWAARGVECEVLGLAPHEQPMLAAGQSHSGPWSHMVVWQHGRIAHDPNPLRLGLVGQPYEFWRVTDA